MSVNAIVQAHVGQPIGELQTPALLLDLAAFDFNARRLASVIGQTGTAWRPHVKALKSPMLARRLLDVGAIGVTVAKVSEAEVMVAGGISSVLIANELPTADKIRRAVDLQRHGEVFFCVDNRVNVELASRMAVAAGQTLPIIVEVDVGEHRAGIRPGTPAVELVQAVDTNPGLRFAGLMGYEGHLLTMEPDRRAREVEAALRPLTETAQVLTQSGIATDIVSAGGSGTYEVTPTIDGITEVQAGGACLMDRFYAEACHLSGFRFALTVLSTVTSRPTDRRVITDAGWKSLSNGAGGLPLVLGRDDVRFMELHAEHGLAELTSTAGQLIVGDRLQLLPGYGDATVHLYDFIYGTKDGLVQAIFPVTARGSVQ